MSTARQTPITFKLVITDEGKKAAEEFGRKILAWRKQELGELVAYNPITDNLLAFVKQHKVFTSEFITLAEATNQLSEQMKHISKAIFEFNDMFSNKNLDVTALKKKVQSLRTDSIEYMRLVKLYRNIKFPNLNTLEELISDTTELMDKLPKQKSQLAEERHQLCLEYTKNFQATLAEYKSASDTDNEYRTEVENITQVIKTRVLEIVDEANKRLAQESTPEKPSTHLYSTNGKHTPGMYQTAHASIAIVSAEKSDANMNQRVKKRGGCAVM